MAFFLLVSGCSPADDAFLPPPPTPTAIHLWLGIEDGAGPLAELLEREAPAGNGIVLHLISGNRRGLMEDLAAGELDAIFIHQLPLDPANSLWFSPVAVDGLALIVHPSNPVADLTWEQVGDIFNGEIDRWAEVGGDDHPIELLIRENDDSGRLLFRERVLVGRPVALSAETMSSADELLEAVAANPAAIGYAMMGGLSGDVKPVALDGRLPDRNTTGTQQYRLTVPLYFVSPREPHGPLREILAWLQSADGQGAVGRVYGRVK